MEKILQQLVEKLRRAWDERLVSVVLYGSAAAGDHQAKFSDLNVLCVLTGITPRELAGAEETFRWWRGLGNPSPLLITESEAAACADCFAIEFTDIQSHHRVLYGADVITGLAVGREFYRAELEHELRAKLLRLRQKAAGMLSDPELLCRLLADSVSTFCTLFRHALILHGEPGPAAKREIIASARDRFGIAPQAFEKLLDLREERIRPRDLEPVSVLAAYLQEISTVIEAVDRLDGREVRP